MRKRFTALLPFLMLALSTFSSINQELKEVDASTWTNTGSTCYSSEGSDIIATSNTNKNNNYYVTDQYETLGDYKISVSAKGTIGLPNSREYDIGLVPWYLDQDNYILTYLNWSNTDRPADLRNLQITGRINGYKLYVSRSSSSTSFSASEWNDMWTDNIHLPGNQSNILSVEKITSEDRTYTQFNFTVNNDTSLQFNLYIRDVAKYAFEKPKVGVYAYNDRVTFSDFTFTTLNDIDGPKTTGDGVSRSMNGTLTLDSNTFTFDELTSTSLNDNVYLQQNNLFTNPHMVSLNPHIEEESANSSIAVKAFYENEYNYLNAGVKKIDGKYYAFFDGSYVLEEKVSTLNKTPIYVEEELTSITSLSQINELKVAKLSNRFVLYINGEVVKECTNDFLDTGSSNKTLKRNGFAFSGVKGTISNFEILEYFEPYSYITYDVGATSYSISAKNKDSVSYSENGFNVSNSAISVGNNDEFARIIAKTNYYGNVNISAKFVNYSSDSKVGLVPYMEDFGKYFELVVSSTKVDLVTKYGETNNVEQFDMPSDVTYFKDEGIVLSSQVTKGLLTLKIDGVTVIANKDISFINMESKVSAGVLVSGSSARIENIQIDGFEPLTPIDYEGFTFFGQRANSWTYDKENETIYNTLHESVDNGWKATNALYPNTSVMNLYMGANIRVTKRTGSEWKVGIMPYYKDADNHVIVWISQWGDGACKICVTARLNGTDIQPVWREVDVGINMMNNNYLEAQIEGDVVKVYLNRSVAPVFTTTFTGLSNRNMENAFTGFQVGNGMEAIFTEFNMLSSERVYKFNELPVISIIGRQVTEGTVGETISLPIFDASNSVGDILTVVVKVYGPDNNEVQLSGSRFTPSVEGTYRVVATCTDSWGNEAEPLEYTITISKASENNNENNENNNNNNNEINPDENEKSYSTVIALSTTGSVLVVGGIIAFFILRKKKLF